MTEPLFARTRLLDGGSPDGTYRLGRIEGWPCTGYITTRFGVVSTLHPAGHSGLDIGGVGDTTAVFAPAAGRVLLALPAVAPGYESWTKTFGASVVLEHAQHVSLYAHLSAVMVAEGEAVAAGRRLGTTGNTGFSTGAHLHWAVAPRANRWFSRAAGLIDPLSLAVDARAQQAPSVAAEHVVVAGDTLGRIAQRYGLTTEELALWNRVHDPSRIFVGQRLRLTPPPPVPAPTPAPAATLTVRVVGVRQEDSRIEQVAPGEWEHSVRIVSRLRIG